MYQGHLSVPAVGRMSTRHLWVSVSTAKSTVLGTMRMKKMSNKIQREEDRRRRFIQRTTVERPWRLELMQKVRAGEITLAEAKAAVKRGPDK